MFVMARPKLNGVTLDYYSPDAGVFVVDIARGLSLLNRRSYRSGYVYSVDYIEYIGAAGDTVMVGKIPESYAALGAYKLGFDAWRRQRTNALEESEFMEPGKWSDFKVYYNELHYDATWTELMPRGLSGATLTEQLLDTTGSEWNRATIEYNDLNAATVTPVEVGMLGDSDIANSYGSLMDQFGKVRVATLSPDPLLPAAASGTWISRTGEESSDMASSVIDLIEDENDQPPYANQADTALDPTYVGNSQSAPCGVIVDFSTAGATGRSVNLDGGLIPCGLLAIATSGTPGEFRLRVHVTRGTYKGVAAMSMGSFS